MDDADAAVGSLLAALRSIAPAQSAVDPLGRSLVRDHFARPVAADAPLE